MIVASTKAGNQANYFSCGDHWKRNFMSFLILLVFNHLPKSVFFLFLFSLKVLDTGRSCQKKKKGGRVGRSCVKERESPRGGAVEERRSQG